MDAIRVEILSPSALVTGATLREWPLSADRSVEIGRSASEMYIASQNEESVDNDVIGIVEHDRENSLSR